VTGPCHFSAVGPFVATCRLFLVTGYLDIVALSYWNKMVPRVFGDMDMRKTALVRAFELARSGKCLNISELLLRLTAERYDASQIQGPSLRKQLVGLIEVAKRPL
jgi:hypothetical protein